MKLQFRAIEKALDKIVAAYGKGGFLKNKADYDFLLTSIGDHNLRTHLAGALKKYVITQQVPIFVSNEGIESCFQILYQRVQT